MATTHLNFLNSFLTVLNSSIGVRKGLPNTQRKKDAGKKTLVLDLDETLIHSESSNHMISKPKNSVSISWKNSSNNSQESAYTRLRPSVFKFLALATELFEVVLFTASMPQYAKQIVKLLDRSGYHFYLLTRND